MKKNVSTYGRCGYSELTELLCLGIDMDESDRQTVSEHIAECPECQKRFNSFQTFYKQVDNVFHKPVSNKALDLAKQLNAKETVYGLVICQPLDTKDEHNRSYKTKVVFTANGKPNQNNMTLGDFDFSSLSEDSIAIRAMTDKQQQKLLLYLWSPSGDNFDGWEVNIPHAGNAKFNPSGMSKIPLCDIEDLGNKVIYFNEQQNKQASGNRFSNIMNAIFPN